jgi:hypothetical protein
MLTALNKLISKHNNIIILVLLNIFIVILFTFIYKVCHANDKTSFITSNIKVNANDNKVADITIIDYFLLSVAIQSGVGYASINPVTNTSKIIVSIQQFLLLFSGLIAVYLFILEHKYLYKRNQ